MVRSASRGAEPEQAGLSQTVRRVCNAASKFGDVSLKASLMAEPDLSQLLVGMIFRFRKKPIALTADVEAMFLQVKVPRFRLQCAQFERTTPISVYDYKRHIFGAKSSLICGNYALQHISFVSHFCGVTSFR